MTTPNPKNFCGGNFQDWLEVNLTDRCNGKCAWCIEKKGWHPHHHAEWFEIVAAALATKRKNIILLGGEPTLHPDLGKIINQLHRAGRHAWVTTNGSKLTPEYVRDNLYRAHGVNVSIHHYYFHRNKQITGLSLTPFALSDAIQELKKTGAHVRFNCNCILGAIDSVDEIDRYIREAQKIGADKVRFAELKEDDELFVDLAEILSHKYGLNDNPFLEGCNSDAVIHGMPVNFRQMCGLQTGRRARPTDPIQEAKQVLYYDGNLYNGWQTQGEGEMTDKRLVEILEQVASGEMTVTEAALAIDREMKPQAHPGDRIVWQELSGAGCQY